MLPAAAVLARLRDPHPPDAAVLAGLEMVSRYLWATQTSPRRPDGTALAQLHVALAQDELSPLGSPADVHVDDVDVPRMLHALGVALRRNYESRRLTSLIVAANHVGAAESALATAWSEP